MDHYNGLTPAEAERLALLLEEMGEAQQIIGKILRHGYESFSPADPTTTNRTLLKKELGDVLAAMKMMDNAGDIAWAELTQWRLKKQGKVAHFLHHQTASLIAKMGCFEQATQRREG